MVLARKLLRVNREEGREEGLGGRPRRGTGPSLSL